VVIVDNMDDFFTVKGDFLIAHDKKNPTKIEGNSSVFRFEIGQYPQISNTAIILSKTHKPKGY
jgi:hypothetical protein